MRNVTELKQRSSMNQETIYDKPEHRPIPLVGQRILKTSIAVFLCLMIYYLQGYSGSDMPTEAMITAIICMQPSATAGSSPSTAWPERWSGPSGGWRSC